MAPVWGRGGGEMNDHIPDPTKMISDTPRLVDQILLSEKNDWTADLYRVGCDLQRELNAANQRIKRLEETLDKTTKIASQRINRLEDRIHRASIAFFRDGSDGHVASQMLQILEEERGKQ